LWALSLEAENMFHTAMNNAATTGPMTNPLRPKAAMPPSVERDSHREPDDGRADGGQQRAKGHHHGP
jgi:hypothetical protein